MSHNFFRHDAIMEPRQLLQWLLDQHGDNSNSLAAKLKGATKQPQIHKFLSGKAKQPRHSTLEPIARYYNIPVESLYSEDEADRVFERLNNKQNHHPSKSGQALAATDIEAAVNLIADALMRFDPLARAGAIGNMESLCKAPERADLRWQLCTALSPPAPQDMPETGAQRAA